MAFKPKMMFLLMFQVRYYDRIKFDQNTIYLLLILCALHVFGYEVR